MGVPPYPFEISHAPRWYYRAGEQVVSPVSLQEVRALAASGTITPSTGVQIDRDGSRTDWTAAAVAHGLFDPKVVWQPVCNRCGRTLVGGGCEPCRPFAERDITRLVANLLLGVSAFYAIIAVVGGIAMASKSGGEIGFTVFLRCTTTGVLILAAAVGLKTLLRIEAGRSS